MILTLSPELITVGDQLVTQLTGFTVDEENFDICHDYLVSNLLYHTYLEPHERDIERKLAGLADKWEIQSRSKKAEKSRKLLEKLNKATVFQEEHEQHDLKTRLLSLLMHLSNADDDKEDEVVIDEGLSFTGDEVESEAEAAARKVAAVRKMLLEGEQVWRPPIDSDLSDWSTDEDTAADPPRATTAPPIVKYKRAKVIERLPGAKVPLKPPIPMSRMEVAVPQILVDADEAQKWLELNVMPPYWAEDADSKHKYPLKVTNRMPEAHLVQTIEQEYMKAGVPVDDKIKLSEYQVIRECLWILRNPLCKRTPLFRYSEELRVFQANPVVCIPSLMPESLSSALSNIRDALTSLFRLFSFVSHVLDRRQDTDTSDFEKPPFTYEAYAEALTNVLTLFSADLLSIESKVHQSLYTLMDLMMDLDPWLKVVNSLAAFHKRAVDDHRSSTDRANWELSVILIASLNNILPCTYQHKLFAIYVDLLLKTLAPYFRIMGVWLTQGRLEDYRGEFVYAIKESVFHAKRRPSMEMLNQEDDYFGSSWLLSPDERFWTEGFVTRPYQGLLKELHLDMPEMFDRTLPRVLTCGKSIAILTILEKQGHLFNGIKTDFVPIQDLVASTEFYDAFLNNLKIILKQHQLPANDDDHHEELKVVEMSSATKAVTLKDVIWYADDLDKDLVAAFNLVFEDMPVPREEPLCEQPLVEKSHFLVLSNFGLDPMKPMGSSLERALVPVVKEHSQRACSRLVHLFRHTLDLHLNLANVRRVYLMEAGDLMSEFYSDMFVRMEQGLDLNSAALTVYLHDCLCRRYPTEEAEKFTIVGIEDSLDSLQLDYNVPWPLNIVLHSRSLQMYNKVFVFLLKVKRAMWALQRIRASDLVNEDSERDQEDSFDEDSKEFESLEQRESKVHRVLLLKSWLLHFVGNVHAYFMTRVLHSTELELKMSLSECGDLDAILTVHDKYIERVYDRCFLHPSATVLRKAVLKVIHASMDLYERCRLHVERQDDKGPFIIDLMTLKSLEENYAQSHQFLASTLRSMTQKRNVAYLDGLAAALVHSCPSVL